MSSFRWIVKRTLVSRFEEKAVAAFPEMATVFATFRLMRVAEDEIQQAIKRSPKHEFLIRQCFLLLNPPDRLRNLTEELYRDHCRELIRRVQRKQDTKLGTRAELIALLHSASLARPPAGGEAGLYVKLFNQVFPDNKQQTLPEPYEGVWAEMESDLRKKLADPARVLKKVKRR